MNRRDIASCIAVSLFGSTVAFAQPPTEDEIWGYTTTATGTQVFDTLAEAEAAIRSIDAAHASLVASGSDLVTQNEISISHTAQNETLPPSLNPPAWYYTPAFGPAEGPFSTFEEAYQTRIEPQLWVCPAEAEYQTTTNSSGVVIGASWWFYSWDVFADPSCSSPDARFLLGGVGWGNANPSCETSYGYDQSTGLCVNNTAEGIMVRRLSEIDDSCVGNPCYVSTGNKHERYVDYEGVGLRFERFYNSRYADYPQGELPLGAGWTHSYAARVVLHPDSGEPTGLFRPDGTLLALEETGTSQWTATDGSMVQVREQGGMLRVFLPSGDSEIYTAAGRLTSLIDASGRVTALSYDTLGRLMQVTGPFGHQLTLRWQTTGNPVIGGLTHTLDRIVDPAGREIDYTIVSGRLTGVEYQDGSDLTYLYEDGAFPDHLTGVVDERQIRFSTFGYDSRGRPDLTEHAGGFQRWSITYNADNTVAATDANAVISDYGFQAGVGNQRVVGTIERSGASAGRVNETTGQHRVLSETDRRGVQSTYQYSTYHLTTMTEAFGTPEARTTTFGYLNDTSQLTTFAQSPSSCGTGLYKTLGTAYLPGTQLVQQRSEIGYVSQSGSCQSINRAVNYEYGLTGSFTRNNGLPTAIRGPRVGVADDVTFTYHECTTGAACGQVSTMTNAAGHVWTFNTYNAHGLVTQMTQPNGAVVTYGYDLRQRLRTITETASGLPARTTTYDYWGNGLLRRVTDPTGAFLEYTYNDARLLTEIRDNSNNRIEYGYDLAGNRTSEMTRDPAGVIKSTRAFDYDDFNRLDTVSVPNQTSGQNVWDYDYGPTGLLKKLASPEGRITDYDIYDPLGRLGSFLDASNQRTTYDYDAQDDLVSVEDPRTNVTTYAHSDLGDIIREISPDRGTTTYTHDAAGNVLTKTDARGVVATYGYDALDRLTSIIYPDTTLNVTLGYDSCTNGVGKLCTMTDGSGSTAYQYNTRGNLVGRTITIGTVTASVGYAYDAADRLVKITFPAGRTLDYARNSLGQVTTVTTTSANGLITTTLASNLTYAPFGPMKALTYGNGIALSRTYDQSYRLTAQTAGSVQNLTFGYDDDEHLTSLLDGINSGRNQTLIYDDLERLTDAVGGYGTMGWTYDAVGNRQTATGPGGSETYTYPPSSNRLSQILSGNSKTLSYDANGNVTGDGYYTLIYGDHNRLSEARVSGSPVGRYTYNGLGQRVKKDNGAVTLFLYDEAGRLVGEYDSMGFRLREMVWLDDDTPLAVIVDDAAYFVHSDQLGTPRAITNGAGAVVWRWDSDPFGTTAANTDPDGNGIHSVFNLRFPGQYFDSETGLHYNYFRDYDPAVGRYVESDPMGLLGGLGTFGYANGNPLAYIDPYGLMWQFGDPLPDSLVNGIAGFGDTASLGLSSYIRGLWDIGSVDKCSAAYATGRNIELGMEIGLTGGSFALRRAAMGVTQAAARAGQGWHGVRGVSAVHHINPLFEGLFPTAALPASIRHSRLNLQLLTIPEHTAAHRALRRTERYLVTLFNPATTGARVGKALAEECECRP